MIMAIAIKGCVITRDYGDGTKSMRYKKVCEKCGYTDPTEGQHTGGLGKGNKFKGHFKCKKCGNNQEIIIEGTN